MLHRLIPVALNPFFQAFVVAAMVILFVPLGLVKYKASQADMTTHFDRSQFCFADLDQDGISERIHTFFNESGNVGVVIKVRGVPDEQWNFKGIYKDKVTRFVTGDYNNNGREEVYLFTLVNDSIFLQALEFGAKMDLFIRDRFIARLGKNLKDPDFLILPGKVTDMTGDGFGELVFAINAGFSRQPRNVFVYDIHQDTLKRSPESGAFIGGIYLNNLDEDPYDEVIVHTSATDNYNEDPVPFSDTSSWLMVLDHDLDFMFPPVEFPGRTGEVFALVTESASFNKWLFCATVFKSSSALKKKFFIADLKGNIIREKEFTIDNPYYPMHIIPAIKGMKQEMILGMLEKDGFYEIDNELNFQKVSDVLFTRRAPDFIDIDQDGTDEIILLKSDHQKHQILRYDFSDPVDLDFPVQSTNPLFSIKLNGEKAPQLSVQGDQVWKLFDYGINPVYHFRFLIYLAIYLILLTFILIIRKLNSIQLKRRYETEQKIATLQLAGIKTQMEPHFIFNVINSIGSNIYREQKDQAYQLVLRFSNMVRSLLSFSDQLVLTLKEEVDFVGNFLELEKMRFPELFSYSVIIAEDVDLQSVVPKMIIQLHAENALKHGLRPKGFGGLMEIGVTRENDYLQITIRDNGVGRNFPGQVKEDSTGKGMKILQQLFETYNKHNRQPILQEIIDLFDENNHPSGTLVKILVPAVFNEKIY